MRKKLPAWILEGLHKAEDEKQKQRIVEKKEKELEEKEFEKKAKRAEKGLGKFVNFINLFFKCFAGFG